MRDMLVDSQQDQLCGRKGILRTHIQINPFNVGISLEKINSCVSTAYGSCREF
jgi:hypothetical protein